MDHTGGGSRRHLDFGFVGVSALEGEIYRDATPSCQPCVAIRDENIKHKHKT